MAAAYCRVGADLACMAWKGILVFVVCLLMLFCHQQHSTPCLGQIYTFEALCRVEGVLQVGARMTWRIVLDCTWYTSSASINFSAFRPTSLLQELDCAQYLQFSGQPPVLMLNSVHL